MAKANTSTRPSSPILAAPGMRRAGERDEEPGRPIGEEETRGAAQQREHERLGDDLPHQPGAAGAERGADGELASPRGRAAEHQVRQVGAGDEQDEADRAGQHRERALDAADHLVPQ